MQKLTHVILTMIYICIYIFISTILVYRCKKPDFRDWHRRAHWSHTVSDSSPWSTYKSESSDPTPRVDQSKPANRAFYSPQPFSRIRALSQTGLLPLSLIIRAREVWRYINIGRWSLLGDVRSFVSVFETFLDRPLLSRWTFRLILESFLWQFEIYFQLWFNSNGKKKKKKNNYTFLWIGEQFYK